MISIVVPAYNAEKTINRCIESIMCQTYEDWELIIVDDGSNDDTFFRCQSFTDERIKVFHKKNGGVSSARNLGISKAIGDYLTFIDADDYIEPCYLENLSKGEGCDLVITGFFYGEYPQNSYYRLHLHSKEKIAQHLSFLINDDQMCFPWGRLFKRAIIMSSISFDEKMRFAEDNVFNWQYLCRIKSIYIDTTLKDYHKTADESSNGYNLSFDEMDYIDRKLFLLSNEIEGYYDIKLNLDDKHLMHVSFLGNMLELPASRLVDYYKKYHPAGSVKKGYEIIVQTVYYYSLIKIAKENCYDAKIKILKQLCIFMDCSWKLLLNSKIKTRFIIPLIKCHFFRLCIFFIDILMKKV